jgi:precorrin-2/cobalt-factor-2 C20-methyltransferase
VGPGGSEHLTRGALDVLTHVDRVVAPTTELGTAGRAESIVVEALPDLEISRLPFDMTPDRSGGETARVASHLAAAKQLLPWLETGERVGFVTLGDPNIYSTFPSLVRALADLGWNGSVATVPGITAFQALAAATGTVLLDGTQALHLVTALDGTDHLKLALGDPQNAVVIYKGGRHLGAITELVAASGRSEGAVVGERLGLSDEHVGSLDDRTEAEASYLVTVIVPPARQAGNGS